MQAINVLDSATELAPAGNRDFLHVYNNSDVVMYVSYDGTPATVAGGFPLPVGAIMTLDNTGLRNIYTKRVTAIHGSAGASKEVRVQGV